MSDLRNILKEEYKKKEEVVVTPLSLIEMIERLMNVSSPGVVEEAKGSSKDEESPGAQRRARMIRLPIQFPTEISVGQRPDDENIDRQLFERWMSKIEPEGDLKAKIGAIENFIKEDTPASVAETLSFLMFLNTFAFMIQEFNASVAGFLWEPFLAAMIGRGSKQVPTSEGDIADVKLEYATSQGVVQRVSLKILREDGPVGGSFTDLVDHFKAHPDEPMIYVVIKKFEGDTVMKFYEFPVSPETFFYFIGHPGLISETRPIDPVPYVPSEIQSVAQAKKQIKKEKGRGWKVDKITLSEDDALPLEGREKLTPGAQYLVYLLEPVKVPSQPGKGAKLSANARHLWGEQEEYAEWFEKWAGGKNPDFWKEATSSPGYVGNRQFEINWSYAQAQLGKQVKDIGALDIGKEALDAAFARGSASVGTDLTDLFNALADLVEDVSRFFLIDCGSPEGKQQKCTEADEKTRSQSGQEAVEETKVIQRVVNEKIAPRLKDERQLQMFEEIT